MTNLCDDNPDLGSVTDAAREALNVEIRTLAHKRFSEPGWFYAGSTVVRCQRDDATIQAFRKSYISGGREYFYVACVCTECLSAVSVADLGIGTGDLGLPAVTRKSNGERHRARTDRPNRVRGKAALSNEPDVTVDQRLDQELDDLDFHDLVVECLNCLPNERLRTVLSERLGLGAEDMSLRAIADNHGISAQRVSQLENQGVAFVAELAQSDTTSAGHRLAAQLGLSTPPDHLAIARRIHPRVRHNGTEMARRRAMLWTLMAGAGPSCARHVAEMVAQQVHALRDWEKANSHTPNAGRAAKTLRSWLSDIDWPAARQPERSSSDFLPVRKSGQTSRSGAVHLAKVDRQVSFESSLERKFFSLLDRASDVASFVEQPCRIKYEFEGKSRRYYPDALVEFNDGRIILVEVKDAFHLVDAENLAKYESARAYAHAQGWGWVVCTAGSVSLAALKDRPIQPHILQAFQERLSDGPIKAKMLKALKGEVVFDALDLLAMTLQQGWTMKHSPFRLSADPVSNCLQLSACGES